VAAVVIQTGFGQNTGGACPDLRVDVQGFPLNPPYSEYGAGGSGEVRVDDVDVLDDGLPCCAVITFRVVTVGTAPFQFAVIVPTVVPVPANGVLRQCIPPAQDVSGQDVDGPPNTFTGLGLFPPFPQTCAAAVTRQITVEDVNGVVRNCDAGNGGGSVYSTGGNAN
jgi:hypothetical protein